MYKLLIVEDDLIIAKGLQKHFEKYHYHVIYSKIFNSFFVRISSFC